MNVDRVRILSWLGVVLFVVAVWFVVVWLLWELLS